MQIFFNEKHIESRLEKYVPNSAEIFLELTSFMPASDVTTDDDFDVVNLSLPENDVQDDATNVGDTSSEVSLLSVS